MALRQILHQVGIGAAFASGDPALPNTMGPLPKRPDAPARSAHCSIPLFAVAVFQPIHFRFTRYTLRAICPKLRQRYLCCMSLSSFSIYISHKRICDRLELAARRKPAFGKDPILNFIEAAASGSVIEWHDCTAVADRMEQLAQDWPSMGELARPAHSLARRIRTAARAEMPFCTR